MRIRLRGPSGTSTVELAEQDTLGRLIDVIQEKTGLTSFEIKHGYPPQKLSLEGFDQKQPLSALGIKLSGEQLIIDPIENNSHKNIGASKTAADSMSDTQPIVPQDHNSAPTAREPPVRAKSQKQASLEPPELPVPSHEATMVLRIMPDDNSCLFRAFGSAYLGVVDSMTELRSLVAQTIQSKPDEYSEAILEQKPDDYCIWIQSEDAWGGGIELSILSQHFDIEICSIDVQGLRVDRFNEGRPTRCILVYSGIHYDVIALSPSEPPYRSARAPPDLDQKIFDSVDDALLIRALDLCRILQSKHYYTDTANFPIKCSQCQEPLKGTKGAQEHRALTGHSRFEENET